MAVVSYWREKGEKFNHGGREFTTEDTEFHGGGEKGFYHKGD